ncbi:hypothetical protein [Lysobacter enzymogenes]|uniref:hypothetical protein n=1 Tax=Lysobacter enzymogenes TaxID=69 RepID=UPI001AF9AD8B|nr:hypothetical protein [Lysobacter enzymogenes]QQQ02165.1 hypothetical protein JHW41_04020 [Lysobacter enzymogenes]
MTKTDLSNRVSAIVAAAPGFKRAVPGLDRAGRAVFRTAATTPLRRSVGERQ